MTQAPNLDFDWLIHGFGERDSIYPGDLTTVKQIHSPLILDAAGRSGSICGEGDALVSAAPGVTIAVKTADCVPILIADRKKRVVAAVHAGWRGSAENISGLAVTRLQEQFGSLPEDLSVAVGPSIGACCYEVSPEVAHRFGTWVPKWNSLIVPGKIDLPLVNRIQLENAGVRDIWVAGLCTRCEEQRFWSFRREGEKAGRMYSFIGVING